MMKQWKGKPDVIVAGAGFAGAVAAREMAEAGTGKKKPHWRKYV